MTRKETILRMAKGMRGRAKNCWVLALKRVEKGLQHAFKGRKLKKREARKEFISQVGAGCREHGISYGRLVHGMNLSSIGINRKIMSQLAREEPYSFRAVVEEAKGALRTLVLSGDKSASSWMRDNPETFLPAPTMVPNANAPSTVERGIVEPYTGPPLPPYPRRVKQYS